LNSKKLGVVGNLATGLVFVVSAPAGTGKSTLSEMVSEEFAPHVVKCTTCTTRSPRQKEIPGRDYHFLTKADFIKKRDAGEFLECAEVFGNFYGTLKSSVEEHTSRGKHVILVIDTQGAMKLKEFYKASFIFIAPPSLDELESRLSNRKTEDRAMIEERLKWAETEIQRAESYDYFIINDHLRTAADVLKSIIIAEEHRNLALY
jgi:guanylate kinase